MRIALEIGYQNSNRLLFKNKIPVILVKSFSFNDRQSGRIPMLLDRRCWCVPQQVEHPTNPAHRSAGRKLDALCVSLSTDYLKHFKHMVERGFSKHQSY